MDFYEFKILGQATPANTTAVSIYNPDSGVLTLVDKVIVSNTTTSAVDYRIFIDADGTTYDTTTALFYDISLAANSTDVISEDYLQIPLTSSGNLAIRTGTNNALTFTVIGRERRVV